MDPNSAVDPVAAVVAALDRRLGTRWVGVDGKGATGKTTLAAQIAAALPGSVVVHIDDFARPDVQGWERDRFVAPSAEAAARRQTGSVSALGLRPQRGRRVAHRPGRSAGHCRRGVGHGRTTRCSVGLHHLGRGAVRGTAGASHGTRRSGADGPLADGLDAERGRVRSSTATSGPGRSRVPSAGCNLSLSKGQWSFDRLAAWRRSRSKARSSRSTATR